MSPDEIRPGRTYEGADGERREVYCTVVASYADDQVSSTVRTFVAGTSFPYEEWILDDFAAWAVREVTE